MELFAKECCEAEKYDLKKGLNKAMGKVHQALNSMKCDALNKASSSCQKLGENTAKENYTCCFLLTPYQAFKDFWYIWRTFLLKL